MSRITFGGLASGLDTNALIDQLVQLERAPIIRKEKRIEELGKVRDAWRDINMRLMHLRESLQGLLKKDNFRSMQAKSTDDSFVSAKAGSEAAPATYEVQVSEVATHHTVAMQSDLQTMLDKGVGEALGLSGTFTLKNLTADGGEDVEIVVKATDSLMAVKKKINDADAGVTASVFAGHLMLKSDMSGTANEIVLSHKADSGDDVLDILGIYNTDESTFHNETVAVQDARFSVNGINFVRSSNAVDDLVDHVTFNINEETTAPVFVQVGADIERAVEAMTAFVEQYNSVNDFVREKLERPDSETKGSTRGLLQGDTTLMKIERSLRTMINSPVSNSRYQDEEGNWQQKKFHSLSSLGVMTVDKAGYLQLNENMLATALQEDPESVFSVMQYELKDENGFGTGQFSGVAMELDNYLKRLLVTDQDSQGRPLRPIAAQREAATQQRIEDLYRRIEVREVRLLRYEERLVRQFTAMERYISTMQSQSQELDNMIGQLAGFGGNQKK